MVRNMTRNNPWSRFGNDLLLGVKADQSTNRQQQEFLPNNLMYDFDHAQIYKDGQYRPLVKERRTAVPGGVQMVTTGFPLSPKACAIILMFVGTLLSLWEWIRKKAFLLWDMFLMLISGIIGFVLTLMLFSQHPTVSLNLQLTFFNPIHLIFLWPVIKGRGRVYWLICPVLFIIFLGCYTWQSYAEGIWVLAYCLLLQSYIHTYLARKK